MIIEAQALSKYMVNKARKAYSCERMALKGLTIRRVRIWDDLYWMDFIGLWVGIG